MQPSARRWIRSALSVAMLSGATALAACENKVTLPDSSGGSGGAAGSTNPGGEGGGTIVPTCVPGDQMACYSGAPGTEGVGTCHGGLRTCKPDGSEYGLCEGEMTPQAEICDTPQDEDCDGATPPCPSVWSRPLTGDDAGWAYNRTTEPAFDRDGNVVVGGLFAQTLDFGSGISLQTDSQLLQDDDGWVAKLDPDWHVLWARRFGGDPLDSLVLGVDFDADGNVFVAGSFEGTVQIGDTTLQSVGKHDIYVAKLDANGEPLWSFAFGAPGYDDGMFSKISAASDGGVFVEIGLSDSAPVGGGMLGPGIHVLKVSASGSVLWTHPIVAETEPDLPTSGFHRLKADGSGGVILFGDYYQTPVDLGAGPLPAFGAGWYLGELDANGDLLWNKAFDNTTASNASLRGVDVNASGDIVVTGNAECVGCTMDFGGGPLMITNGGVLAKLASNGDHVFSRAFSSSDITGNFANMGMRAILTPSGDVYWTGSFAGQTDLGKGPLVTDDVGLFVARYDATGAPVWTSKYDYGAGQHLLYSPSGNPVLIGNYVGTPDFGAGPLPPVPTPYEWPGPVLFIASLAP